MRALVVGIGAVGGWLLARLTEGGADVTGLARGETFERLAAGEPLALRSSRGDWTGPVRVVDRPGAGYDLTFVCTKSAHTASVAEGLVRAGVVVSVQNGIDNPGVLAAGGGWDRVVPTVVYSGCVKEDAVTVRHTSNGFLVLDDEPVGSWLAGHGVRADVVDDLRPRQWMKLASNVMGNSLTALLESLHGPIRDHPAMDRVARDLLAEVFRVARADGVALPDEAAEQVMAGRRRLPAGNGTSMLWDRRAGRALEVDALTGAVLRRADAHGIDVPVVRTVDALVRFVSDAATGAVVQPPPEGADGSGGLGQG